MVNSVEHRLKEKIGLTSNLKSSTTVLRKPHVRRRLGKNGIFSYKKKFKLQIWMYIERNSIINAEKNLRDNPVRPRTLHITYNFK